MIFILFFTKIMVGLLQREKPEEDISDFSDAEISDSDFSDAEISDETSDEEAADRIYDLIVKGDLEQIKNMIRKDENNYSYLADAIKVGNIEIIIYLLDEVGVNINLGPTVESYESEVSGDCMAIFTAVELGNMEIIRLLLQYNPELNFIPELLYDDSILSFPAKSGNLELAELLILHGAKPSVDNYKCIYVAAHNGHKEIAECYLRTAVSIL